MQKLAVTTAVITGLLSTVAVAHPGIIGEKVPRGVVELGEGPVTLLTHPNGATDVFGQVVTMEMTNPVPSMPELVRCTVSWGSLSIVSFTGDYYFHQRSYANVDFGASAWLTLTRYDLTVDPVAGTCEGQFIIDLHQSYSY